MTAPHRPPAPDYAPAREPERPSPTRWHDRAIWFLAGVAVAALCVLIGGGL